MKGNLFCRGGINFMVSNNDCGVRVYDMEKFQLLNHFRFPWPVNVSLGLHDKLPFILPLQTCSLCSLCSAR